MYVVAHPGSFVLLETREEAITRAKCFAADHKRPLTIYRLEVVRWVPAPEDLPEVKHA